jgi:hypothetical protein
MLYIAEGAFGGKAPNTTMAEPLKEQLPFSFAQNVYVTPLRVMVLPLTVGEAVGVEVALGVGVGVWVGVGVGVADDVGDGVGEAPATAYQHALP